MSRVFHKRISSASSMEYETKSNRIMFTIQQYDAKRGAHVMVTVDIDEEEWLALIKYGEDAGFHQS